MFGSSPLRPDDEQIVPLPNGYEGDPPDESGRAPAHVEKDQTVCEWVIDVCSITVEIATGLIGDVLTGTVDGCCFDVVDGYLLPAQCSGGGRQQAVGMAAPDG